MALLRIPDPLICPPWEKNYAGTQETIQPQDITVTYSVPNYTAWRESQVCVCVNNLPIIVT